MNYASDRRLDVLLLGPMGEKDILASELGILEQAVDSLFREKAFQDLFLRYGIISYNAAVPNRMHGNDIIGAVLEEIDIADLVIFDLNPKRGQTLASPNVFYELALVHALGIPYLIVASEGVGIPFYADGSTRSHFVPEWEISQLQDAIRAPLFDFLNDEGSGANLAANPVSNFYGRIPLVDISAAMGLATGYYFNFLRRLILDDGLVTLHPDKIKQVIVVLPSSLESTFNRDMETLEKGLAKAGISWTADEYIGKRTKDLGDKMRGIAFNHADGIVFDIPSTVYPLQHSPRLHSQRSRMHALGGKPIAARRLKTRHLQTSDALLGQIERAILHHLLNDGNQVRGQLIHFSSINELPARIESLR